MPTVSNVGSRELFRTGSNNASSTKGCEPSMHYPVSVLSFAVLRPQHQAGLLLGDASLFLLYIPCRFLLGIIGKYSALSFIFSRLPPLLTNVHRKPRGFGNPFV